MSTKQVSHGSVEHFWGYECKCRLILYGGFPCGVVSFLLFHLFVGAGSVVLLFVCHNKYVFVLIIRVQRYNYFRKLDAIWALKVQKGGRKCVVLIPEQARPLRRVSRHGGRAFCYATWGPCGAHGYGTHSPVFPSFPSRWNGWLPLSGPYRALGCISAKLL